MSADISIDQGVGAAIATQPVADLRPLGGSNSVVESAPASTGVSPLLPNPRLTVDPTLNRVVLEFFNSSGTLTNTIPSQKQLEAYRLAALSGESSVGPSPPGQVAAGEAVTDQAWTDGDGTAD